MTEISTWLESIGISPLLAGLILGGLIVWLLKRGGSGAENTLGLSMDTSSSIAKGRFQTRLTQTEDARIHLELDGKSIDIPPDVAAEILQHLRDNHKIEAIKRLREATGLGLVDAKNMVEMMEKTAG